MISNLDPVLQFRRLKPQLPKEKSHHDSIPKMSSCHKTLSRIKIQDLSRQHHNETGHHVNPKKTVVKECIKYNHHGKGPKPYLTVQKKVRYRHMEVGATEFINGPKVYHSRQIYENERVKRSVPLILNTLHHT